MGEKKYVQKLMIQLGLSVTILIVLIEAALLFGSYRSREEKFNKLNIELSERIEKEVGISFEKPISAAYIENDLKHFVFNVVGLTLIIIACVVAGFLLIFHRLAGRYIIGLVDVNRAAAQSGLPILYEGEVPNNEVGSLIDSRNSMMKRLSGVLNELRNAKEENAKMFEESFDALMTLSPPYWNFQTGNPAALNLFKVASNEEFSKLGPWSVSPEFQPDGRLSSDAAKDVIGQAMETGSCFFDWIHRDLEGKEIVCNVLLSRVQSAGNSFLLATVRDITEKRQIEKMLNHSAKLASIGELAAGVGHEINNPLAVARGYLSLIFKNAESISLEKIMSSLHKVETSLERISKIVTGLRVFARSDNSDIQTRFSPLPILKEVDGILTEIYLGEGIRLDFSLDQLDSSFMIIGDEGKFRQVIVNLISNARDAFSEQSEKVIKVSADISVDVDFVKIEVEDNGQGISPKIQSKIFEPFFTTKAVGVGTGIGLSIVHKFIVDEFKGQIDLESKVGQGSKFSIRLPLSREAEIDHDQGEVAHIERIIFPKLKVLVVEDESDVRELIVEMLESFNFTIVNCKNGAEGLEVYREGLETFDLIISDMKMPVMNGVELVKEIRSIPVHTPPLFIFITGGINIDFEDPKSDVYQLMDSYLYKPFTEIELGEVIKGLLNNR